MTVSQTVSQTVFRIAPLALCAAASVCAASLAPVRAQGPTIVSVKSVKASPATVAPGGHGTLLVTLSIAPGYHVNAHQPNDPSLIPTSLSATSAGATFGAARYPASKTIKVSYAPKPILVYEASTTILVPFTVAKSAPHGKTLAVLGTLSFQGCNQSSCFAPTSLPVRAAVGVK